MVKALTLMRKVNNMLYTDTLDIYRFGEVRESDHTTTTDYPATPTHEGIPCRISKKDFDSTLLTGGDSNPTNYQMEIFCGPEVNVKKGDRIVLTKVIEGIRTIEYEGIAGLPAVYETHQEFLMSHGGDA